MERATVDKTAQPKGVEGSTVAEAFELTAVANPDRVALRTRGGEAEVTWGRVSASRSTASRWDCAGWAWNPATSSP